MKLLPGILASLLILSLPVLAQHDDHHDQGNGHHDVGGGYVPHYGPPAYQARGEHREDHHEDAPRRAYNDREGHPELRTSTTTANGWDTKAGATTSAPPRSSLGAWPLRRRLRPRTPLAH